MAGSAYDFECNRLGCASPVRGSRVDWARYPMTELSELYRETADTADGDVPLPIGRLRDPSLHRRRTGCPFHDVRMMLRDAGLRPTRQRLALGWLLFAKGERHVSAEMLHEEALRARFPVSLATVYNTLHQFTGVGLLREVPMEGARAYFDTKVDDHHHFYFEGDGKLVDIPAASVRVGELPEPPPGFEIARVDVVVRLKKRGA